MKKILLLRPAKVNSMNESIWNRNYVFLVLSNFLMYVIYYAILSTLPVYLVTMMHASKVQVGVVVGAYTVASVLIRPFSGFALDRFGRRTIFLLALLLYTLLIGGYVLALTIFSLIILRIAQGLAWAFTTVSGSTMAIDIVPVSRRGQGIGYFALSTTLGMSVGPVIGLFITHKWGYMSMFISGCFISAASLAFAAAVRVRRHVPDKHVKFNWTELFEKNSIIPSLNVFIPNIAYGGLVSFVALYGKELGIQNSSLYFLIFSVGIAAARITVGKVFDNNGPRVILTLCMTLLVIGYPVLALAGDEMLFYLSAVIIGFGNGVIFPAFQSMINNIADPSRRGAANSTLFTAIDLGMGAGMLSGGFIAQHFSISAIFLINGILCAIGLFFFRFHVLGFYESRRKML
jgi:MFS family permease